MNRSVLIVDDSPIMRGMLRKGLELSGLSSSEIFESGDGDEALAWLQDRTATCVITDLHMPRLSGIALIENMQRDDRMRAIPVVVASSDAGPRYNRQLKELGVRAVLRKPFRPEQVCAILKGIPEIQVQGEEP